MKLNFREENKMEVDIINIFNTGGAFMWPLLGLSVIALVISLERLITCILFHLKTADFITFLRSKGEKGRPIFEGVDKTIFQRESHETGALLEQVFQLVFDKMNRIVELLGGIGNIAPLLGFIGTVSGMIVSFQSIAEADKVSVKLVATGISEALITTGYGLIIAVICLFFEHMFRYYLVARAHLIEEEVNAYTNFKR